MKKQKTKISIAAQNINHYILGVDRTNFLIYLTFEIIGIACTILSFLDINSPFCILSGSIGISWIGTVLLTYCIEYAKNTRYRKNISQLKDREIGFVFYELRELLRMLYKDYIIYSQKHPKEGTSITICAAIEEMRDYYNANIRSTNTRSDIEITILNKKKNLTDLINDTIINNRNYLLDNNIISTNEFEGLKTLYIFLYDSVNTIYDIETYYYMINYTYSDLKKLNDCSFIILKNNQVAISDKK